MHNVTWKYALERRPPLYVRLLFFHSNHQQRFFLERMLCSVLPRPAGTIHVTRTRRRDRSVSTVVVYDVRVANGAAIVESRRALGGQVIYSWRGDGSLGNVDWRPGDEVASHGGCAALWDSFLRHRSARSDVYSRVKRYVAASGGGRVCLRWWRWCVWCGCL
jgi:hypothetical protein